MYFVLCAIYIAVGRFVHRNGTECEFSVYSVIPPELIVMYFIFFVAFNVRVDFLCESDIEYSREKNIRYRDS